MTSGTSAPDPAMVLIPVEGGRVRLAVEIRGDGSAVVLLHGMGADRHQLDEVAAHLAGAGHRSITFDARGAGDSTQVLRSPAEHAATRHADDLHEIIEVLTLERPVVGGVSMGAATALVHAATHPDRCGGLVLIAPALDADGLAPAAAAYVAALAAALERDGWDGVAMIDAAMVDAWRKRFDADTLAALWRGFPGDLPPLRLEAVGVPALVVAWPDDALHPLPLAESCAARLPDARLVVLDAPPATPDLPAAPIAAAITQFLATT